MTVFQGLQSAHATECLDAIDEVSRQVGADDRELQALAQCLGAPQKTIQRRAAAAFAALSARGVDVRPVLLAALASDEPPRRWGAAYACSLLGTPPAQVLPVLLTTLGCEDGDLRWAAASILVRMKGEALVDELRALLTAGNAAQRKMAVYCLRDLEARVADVEHALFAALDDPDSGVRMAAMSALARLSADRHTVALRVVGVLNDTDPGVRRAAAAILGSLGDRSAAVLAALRAAAAGPDPSLQRAAARSLRLLES